MILASAQMTPRDEQITDNIDAHSRLICRAADRGAGLIVFPEMSLTGYLRESAEKNAFIKDDSRLDKIKRLAIDRGIIIVAGAPIKLETGLHIGSFVILPDGTEQIYTKQFLHEGEEAVFKPSFDNNPAVKIGDEVISFAICADITNSKHPLSASTKNSSIYIASIFYTPRAIKDAHRLLSSYAKQYGMNVLMANFCGKTWGMAAAGRSAFWSADGECVVSADTEQSCLVIAKKKEGVWQGIVV